MLPSNKLIQFIFRLTLQSERTLAKCLLSRESIPTIQKQDCSVLSSPLSTTMIDYYFSVAYLGEEDRLTATLFHGYNSLVRPVPNATSPPIQVAFSLALVLLISLDEKNQFMQTNVWPTMKWFDYQVSRLFSSRRTSSDALGSETVRRNRDGSQSMESNEKKLSDSCSA